MLTETGLVSGTSSCSSTVIDGGALIHRIRWMKGWKFERIFNVYAQYISKNYKNPTIFFDGYEKSTKDQEHIRRNSIPQSSFVNIQENNEVPYTQERYFSLKENKIEFIKLLTGHLIGKGIDVINCSGDADCKIVEVALNCSKNENGTTLVISDDTDVAIMLLYHWNETMRDIYLV